METLTIEKPSPPPSHREVVKVIQLNPGERWQHPRHPNSGMQSHRTEHYYSSYARAWVWDTHADGAGAYTDSVAWPYVVYFSDGTCGVASVMHLSQALRALSVRRIE
jgi:hypothetical protein